MLIGRGWLDTQLYLRPNHETGDVPTAVSRVRIQALIEDDNQDSIFLESRA